MRFKIPPGNLGWVSALWVLLGAFVGYTSFTAGDNYMGIVSLLFCLAGVLIWLDIREVAWPLIVWFAGLILVEVLLLAIRGLAFRPVWAMAMAALTIYELYAWRSTD